MDDVRTEPDGRCWQCGGDLPALRRRLGAGRVHRFCRPACRRRWHRIEKKRQIRRALDEAVSRVLDLL